MINAMGSDAAPVRETMSADAALREVLERAVGPGASGKSDQVEAVAALLAGQRVLLVQATGYGKSIVYWAATRARRAAGAGPSLVISPLIALMRDQVRAATDAGLRAAAINSSDPTTWESTAEAVSRDEIDVLLISPERLGSRWFRENLWPSLGSRVGLVVIDEAHCLSGWGHDFRPDYQRIAATVLEEGIPVLACTATANARVTDDVAHQLGSDTTVLRGTLTRDSLHLSVVAGLDMVSRYAFIDQALGQLEGSGIVYTLTVTNAQRLAQFLATQGHTAAAYTGQTEPAERERIEQQLAGNHLKAVVATSALGMGYDKPDIAFVIHDGSPASPVDYYQQIGRAGRALDTATVVLLPAESDEGVWDYFISSNTPDEGQAHGVLAALDDGPQSVVSLEAITGVRRGRLDALLKLLAVDDVVIRSGSKWQATGRPWSFDSEKFTELARARRAEAALMRAYAAGEDCLERFLRAALDDQVVDGWRCGRCSVCLGHLPQDVPTGLDPARLAAATRWCRGEVNELPVRKRWPTGMDEYKGSITPAMQPGRALAYANDAIWGPLIRAALTGTTTPSEEAVSALVVALTDVSKQWSQSWQRPVAVTWLPDEHTALTSELARRLAEIARIPVLALLTWDSTVTTGGRDASSKQQVLAAHAAIGTTGAAVPHGPVLLVCATWRTGWRATVAAQALADQGAEAILPIAVWQQP